LIIKKYVDRNNWRETRSGVYLSRIAGKVTVNIHLSQKRDNLLGRCPNILDRKGESKMGVLDGRLTCEKILIMNPMGVRVIPEGGL